MRHTNRGPATLTRAETAALLAATLKHKDDYRDHMVIAVALGTGLRISEIANLQIRDVKSSRGAKGLWELRPEAVKFGTDRAGKPIPAERRMVALPEKLRRKMAVFLSWKAARGEWLDPTSPVFRSGANRGDTGLDPRSLRRILARWAKVCGFDRHVNFHMLRHTYGTRFQEANGDLAKTQCVMRHASITSTQVYMHPSIESIVDAVQGIEC